MRTESFLRPWLVWIIGGAALGVLMRVLFGALPERLSGPMSLAFLVGTPLAVGAITIYGTRHVTTSWAFVIFGPWATVALMMLGCALALLEGSICIALLTPLFLACASIGGIAMEWALRLSKTRQSHLKAIALLPLLILVTESHVDHRTEARELRSTMLVDAPPSIVWKEILTAQAIRPTELPLSLTHLIGVPRPVEGINVLRSDGEVRYSKWERGVNFRAVVTERVDQESITWRYDFNEQSFPEGAMDKHVAIGGRYFDIEDTTFNLLSVAGERTELEIVAHYRVTTRVNFYAVPVATILGKDFLATLLGFYKYRSERSEIENRKRAGTSANAVVQRLVPTRTGGVRAQE